MINDYVSVETAEVIDLATDVSVVLDASQNQGQIIGKIINLIATYFNPSTRELGQNVNIPELTSSIQSQDGVITVTDMKFYNRVGGEYSSSVTSMNYVDNSTREIQPTDSTLFALPNQIYQIRYPNKDITVRVKNFQTVTIS
jgi:hypothetical protein